MGKVFYRQALKCYVEVSQNIGLPAVILDRFDSVEEESILKLDSENGKIVETPVWIIHCYVVF